MNIDREKAFAMRSVRIALNMCRNLYSIPAVILLYHRVADLKADPHLLAVSTDNFDRQVKHVSDNYNVCSLSDLVRAMKSNRILPKSVVITFDDGYRDNYCNALPVLRKYNVPASVFVTTDMIGNSSGFWWDKLEAILSQDIPPELTVEIRGVKHTYRTANDQCRTDSYVRLHQLLKTLYPRERNTVLKEIENEAPDKLKSRTNHMALSVGELVEMASSGLIEIGAHTHTHAQLSVLTPEEQFNEINTSKEILENLIGREIPLFSYPFGSRKDYTDDTVTICRKLNFQASCANFPDQVRTNTDPFQLPRFIVRNWTMDSFKKRLSFFYYK